MREARFLDLGQLAGFSTEQPYRQGRIQQRGWSRSTIFKNYQMEIYWLFLSI